MKRIKTLKILVALIVIILLGGQIFWNFKNYQQNKSQLIDELQLELDNSVDKYYINQAHAVISDVKFNMNSEQLKFDKTKWIDSFMRDYEVTKKAQKPDLVHYKTNEEQVSVKDSNLNKFPDVKIFSKINIDSSQEKKDSFHFSKEKLVVTYIDDSAYVFKRDFFKDRTNPIVIYKKEEATEKYKLTDENKKVLEERAKLHKIAYDRKRKKIREQLEKLDPATIQSISVVKNGKTDSLFGNITIITKKNIQPTSTIKLDTLIFPKMISAIDTLLKSKKRNKDFKVVAEIPKSKKTESQSFSKKIDHKEIIDTSSLNVLEANSKFLGDKKIKLYYDGLEKEALKKSIFPLVLSLILTIGVCFTLFYLIKILQKQDKVNEMKNDFISNITHELKTPIAVVTSAIEGIQNFNHNENKEKTNRYLDISNQELKKLTIIVEKILETASLQSKDIVLHKNEVDLKPFLQQVVELNKLKTNKNIDFVSSVEKLPTKIDEFHFENIVNNLIENAIKYGGDKIEVNLFQQEKSVGLEVTDNGGGIPKSYQEYIFDKFYRIPTQNIHNVKGFGVGLYYVKQMVEKHNGSISIMSNSKKTTFKILIPNE